MATRIEYALIAAGISVAIIAVVFSTDKWNEEKAKQPVPVHGPQVWELGDMPFIGENTTSNGHRIVTIQVGQRKDVAGNFCTFPRIDYEKKTVRIVMYHPGRPTALQGYLVACGIGSQR